MTQTRLSIIQGAPPFSEKEQWQIIYKNRALETQKARNLQKIASKQLQNAIKMQLDEQVRRRINSEKSKSKEDVQYYEYIVQKNQKINEQQQKERFEKFIKQKQIEEYNRKLFDQALTSRTKDEGNVYNLQIGVNSQIQERKRAESIRQDVLQGLAKQKQLKQLEKQRLHQQEIQQYQKNEAYQKQQYENRNKRNQFGQKQGVYHFYRDLYNQKMRKEKQFQYKYVDEAQQKRQKQDLLKQQDQILLKKRKKLIIKDALQRQIQLQNIRKDQQKNLNPEQSSFSFINNVYRERKIPYDKGQYSKFLEKQIQEQKISQKWHRYLSQEDYKLNYYQLKNALSKIYNANGYHDRSMDSLGNKLSPLYPEPYERNGANISRQNFQSSKNNRSKSMVWTIEERRNPLT